MSSNKNLFYSLYSTSNNVINSGYTCISAIDEEDTSFDITTDANGNSAGTITDSNGNKLASIDLSNLHVPGITQYNSETRILQPHSGYVLQGQEYGYAKGSYYYGIPKQVKDVKNYDKFIDCDFDIIYDNFAPKKFHIAAKADGKNSITKEINKQFKDNNIEISVSLQTLYDNVDKKEHDYLVFLAQKECYFYYINNAKITIEFQSEDYPNSPFIKDISEIKTYLYELIEKYHPVQENEEYDPSTYQVNCDLYSWLLHNYIDAVYDISSFQYMITCIQNALDNPDEEDYWIEQANIAIQNTVYDTFNFDNYDIDNISIIYNIINEIKIKIDNLNDYYKNFYWLREDKHRRVSLMKYPNGAFKGIVMIPDWPVNGNDEYQALWINHIKSKVKLYILTSDNLYKLKEVNVLSNATLVKEENSLRSQYPEFGSVLSDNLTNSITNAWNNMSNEPDDFDTDYLDPYRPDEDIEDDLAWMGNKYYSAKDDIIGLFRYMQYVNDNNLWNKVGYGYMIIGKEDDVQSQIENLPTSLVVYNPNDVPIRIKYMIFS